MKKYDAIIVGAGITGLSLAYFLKKFGHRAIVIDKRSVDEDICGGLTIWPNGTRTLFAMGLQEKCFELSGNMDEIIYAQLDGTPVTTASSEWLQRNPKIPPLFIERKKIDAGASSAMSYYWG